MSYGIPEMEGAENTPRIWRQSGFRELKERIPAELQAAAAARRSCDDPEVVGQVRDAGADPRGGEGALQARYGARGGRGRKPKP